MEEENIESIKIDKKMSQFVVIGLGRFGKSVATALAELGKEVLVIDTNRDAVNELDGVVSSAVVADATANDVLSALGVQDFDCAIICIGDDLQSSILATLICKDLGVHCVVARANNEQNKKILERIGADIVVFPEIYMAKKVATTLANPSMNEILNLADNFKIVEIPVPDPWQDKTALEIDVRKKYKISIIFIKRADTVISVDSDTVLLKGDLLIVAGDTKSLQSISNKASDVIDVMHSLKDAL